MCGKESYVSGLGDENEKEKGTKTTDENPGLRLIDEEPLHACR